MKLPRTWPVCIIDDQPDEYEKLFNVLNRLRIGYVHVAGDRKATLPRNPIQGLRLVFLDMHLGADTLTAVTASQTAKVFAQTVSPLTAPILVVVWSKYVSEVDHFRQELYRSKPEFAGRLLFVPLDKPMSATQIQVKKLDLDLRAALGRFTPLRLLWGWEALAQQAAVSTSTELSNLAARRVGSTISDDQATETEKVLTALSQVLAILIQAEAGKSGSEATAPVDLLRALSAVHADRLDNSRDRNLIKEAGSVLGRDRVPVSLEEQAAMNRMLIAGPPEAGGPPFKPGTLYHISLFRHLLVIFHWLG